MQNTYLLLLKSNIFPNTNKGKGSQTEDKAYIIEAWLLKWILAVNKQGMTRWLED